MSSEISAGLLAVENAALKVEVAEWKSAVKNANLISQRFEAENVKLKATIRSILARRSACDNACQHSECKIVRELRAVTKEEL